MTLRQVPGGIRPSRPSRLFLPLLYAVAVLAMTVAAWMIADGLQRDDLRGRAAEHLVLTRDHVVAMVDRYRYLPAVVAKDERVRQLLAAPGDPALVAAANQYLETVNGLAGSDVVYLLDPTGKCLASSNWGRSDSFVGQRYEFRPYLKNAIEQGSGSDYAKGATTGKYGYFIASRLGTAGEPAGVAVGKIDLSSLEQAWTAASDRVALVDRAGMIFLSSVPGWRLRPLFPLSPEDRERILRDRQYDQATIDRPPLLPTRPRLGEDFDLPIQEGNVRVKALGIGGSDGWQILAAYETADIPLWAGLVALAVFLAAVLVPTVGVYLRERGRRIQAGELRAILENMSVGIAVFDRALRLMAWNDKYRLLNRYPEDLVSAGRPLSEIIRHNIERGDFGAVDPEQELKKRLDQARESATQQLELRRPDGTWVEIRHSRMSDGRYIRVYGDITERKHTEAALAEHQTDLERLVGQRTAQLELANERLQVAAAQTEAEKRRVEQASRAKTTLLGAVNHDIRNPLNIILNAARLVMKNAALPTQQYANLEKIEAKGRELLELVEDLLDYTRADRVAITEFRLSPIIERCRSAVEHTTAAGVEIVSDVPPDLPVLAQDERKLRRVVINLMDNAAKFTETGTIRVSAARRDGTIEIAVSDTGRGIAGGDIERIFDEGEQVEPGARQSMGGIGLGLAICRRFAGQMGGEIKVRSRLGEGSVFTLLLPIIHPTAGPDAPAVEPGAGP